MNILDALRDVVISVSRWKARRTLTDFGANASIVSTVKLSVTTVQG